MAATQFDRIYHGLSSEVGKFRLAPSGMAWKGADSEGVVSMAAAHIDWVQWMRVARSFQLRVGVKDSDKREHRVEKFDGFGREDHEKLSKLLKDHFGKTLETKEISFKGWNWGTTDFQGNNLAFMVADKTAFELPLNHVTNSNMAGKTEVTLEFAAKSQAKNMGDEMIEIRFHVPGTHTKLKAGGSDAGSQIDVDDNDDEEEISAAQVFHDTIKDKAVIGQEPGDLVLSFEEVLVLTPRGRYDMDMYLEFLRLRGKTYDYKIDYNHISRMFLLPKDDQHVLFILDLRTPIGQGQTRYQYLVMQFSREEEITAELNMSEEEVAKYDKLKKNYEDPTFEVVSGVFRGLAKKKIIGAGSFQSRDGHPGIKANLKAVQGDLFFLEKYIFFVSKQPLLAETADIHQVIFSRVGASMGAAAARTFDLKIVTKSGPEYTFSSINKEDHEAVETYLKDKKIKVKNEMVMDTDLLAAAAGDDDDDDDEDMQSVVSSDDGNARTKVSRGGLDDDDSEEDEDFHASGSDSGSPSDSDDSDSGAETASDASGDRVTAQADKKGKGKEKAKGKETDGAKKPAKKKAVEDKGSGAEDKGKGNKAQDAEGSKKPAKKKKVGPKGSDAEDNNDDDKPKKAAAPKPKPKPKAKKADDAMDVDDEGPPKKKVIKPKEPAKPKPKAKGKEKEKGGDGMDVDEERPKPKPKPKPKVKKAEDGDEPPKKKAKTSD